MVNYVALTEKIEVSKLKVDVRTGLKSLKIDIMKVKSILVKLMNSVCKDSITTPSLPYFHPSPFPDVLCNPSDLIWRNEAITGRTGPSSDDLLTEVFWSFPQL